MSDFKLGDLVKRIADPAHDYRYMKTGEIYTVTGLPEHEPESLQVNDDDDCYWMKSMFELYAPLIVVQQSDSSELTEAYAKIDTLESALEDTVRELISLREGSNTAVIDVDKGEFKPIREMTLEDWEAARKQKWLFADNHWDESILVESVTSSGILFYGYSYPFTVDGVHTKEPEEYQIIKRIK